MLIPTFYLSMAAASHGFFHGLPLKYRVRYGRSRHRHHFRYPASDTLDGMLLCQTLLREIWSWIHHSRRCRSSEWDPVNDFLPHTHDLVLPRLYCQQNHCHASLLPSSSAALTTTRVFLLSQLPRLSTAPLYRTSDHIHHISANCRPPRQWSPRATIFFVLFISSITIARTFRFYGAGTKSSVSTIHTLLLYIFAKSILLLSVVTARRCCLWFDCVSVPLGWDTIYEQT